MEIRAEYPLFEPEDRKLVVTVNGPAAREGVIGPEETLTLTGLAPGRYRVAMVRPGFLMQGGGLEMNVDVPANECVAAALALEGAQTVSGTLYDSIAKPLAGVQIKLERADDRLYTMTDAQGHFSFRKVTPGPYWLATGSDGFAEQYYPLVADQDEASIIYVKPGEDVENVQFYAPGEVRRRPVALQVVRDDGTPAVGARVTLKPARGEDRKGIEHQADAQGRVAFEAFVESAYEAVANDGQGQGLAARLTGAMQIPAGAAAVTGTIQLQPASRQTAGR